MSPVRLTADTRPLPGLVTLALSFAIPTPALAQLITMSKECRAQVDTASAHNASGEYSQALKIFEQIVGECDSKDGVEAVQVGMAHALNGLNRYDDAIAAAGIALEKSEDKSINALFERAVAQEKLGNTDAATADYDQMIALTEKNQNTPERAILYAKVADLNYRAGKTADAEQYIAKASELDPGNPDFLIQQGDWAADQGDYDRAFEYYDQAVAGGRTDVDMYGIRADTRIKSMQDKYGTENVQELRAQMTPDEKSKVCADSKQALDLGLKDMQMDMFVALVCR
jgi:tetratricopeptide (TPR) repeat protein